MTRFTSRATEGSTPPTAFGADPEPRRTHASSPTGSSTLRSNRITIHPDNVSGRDWIYGINAARNTHAISIEDNLVNAASRQYITIGIHLSDYYLSEQRRASQLVARNNTVIDASGGIHVESSRFTLVRDNIVYQTDLNSLLYGWPRAITVRA